MKKMKMMEKIRLEGVVIESQDTKISGDGCVRAVHFSDGVGNASWLVWAVRINLKKMI